jgi:folate-dependent phosphoribosylglycinamide formyltransferase PurN
MRIVILSSSIYSETACAMAVRLADSGYVPVGALSLPTLSRKTMLRKLEQWGFSEAARYARRKLSVPIGEKDYYLQNPYLRPWLECDRGSFRNLNEIARLYSFSIATYDNENSLRAIACLKSWSPDLVVFTGGNILRRQVLSVPRLSVLNAHLGLLPEVRGMSTPEWSLLNRVPVGITIHFMDAGVDTGPILRTYEYPNPERCKSLVDLRQRLVAFGVEKIGEVVSVIDRGAVAATPQTALGATREKDNQFFVMHERLEALAAERLASYKMPMLAGAANE